MTSLLAALAFLTPLPVGARRPGPGTLVWFPLAGALVGAVVGGAWALAAELWPPLVAAAIVVAVDLVVTGALHVDGLADTADGVLPHLDGPERRREVMAAPDVGAFGLAVVVAALLLRLSALGAVGAAAGAQPWALAALWALARGAMAVALVAVPYVGGGLGAAFLGARVPVVWVGAVLVPVALALVADDIGRTLLALVVGAVAATGVVALARRRLGGVTGDVLGAAGVVAETVGLVVLAGTW
jgi:adenosylcobinamide-GDP ribazoletransferase